MNHIRFECNVQASIQMFGGSAPQAPQPVSTVPSQSAADLAAQTTAAQTAAFAQQNAGRASTILTSSQGTPSTPSAAKTLLGD